MAKYRIKRREVEAMQWFKGGDHPRVYVLGGDPYFETKHSVVPLDVSPGDWIVTLPNGDCELLSPEDFEAKYKIAEPKP